MAESEPVTDNDPRERTSVRTASGTLAVLLAAVTLPDEPLLSQTMNTLCLGPNARDRRDVEEERISRSWHA